MRFTGEQPEVAMSGLKTKVKRQFDWPPPKNEKVVYSDTEVVWVVQSTEVQAVGNVLDEIRVEYLDEDQTAMLGEQETFALTWAGSACTTPVSGCRYITFFKLESAR